MQLTDRPTANHSHLALLRDRHCNFRFWGSSPKVGLEERQKQNSRAGEERTITRLLYSSRPKSVFGFHNYVTLYIDVRQFNPVLESSRCPLMTVSGGNQEILPSKILFVSRSHRNQSRRNQVQPSGNGAGKGSLPSRIKGLRQICQSWSDNMSTLND